MPTHIFKKEMDHSILFDFLKPICMTNNNHYIVGYESLKAAKFNEHFDTFLETIKPYYHISKENI